MESRGGVPPGAVAAPGVAFADVMSTCSGSLCSYVGSRCCRFKNAVGAQGILDGMPVVKPLANQRDDDQAVWMSCKRSAEAWAHASSLPSRHHVHVGKPRFSLGP